MKVTPTSIPDVLLIEPQVFGDHRGFFVETWSARRYAEHGLPERFVQDNLSRSGRGTLRGLHFQHPDDQGKLVMAVTGEVFDVAVDVRLGSPTFGKWAGARLSEENKHQLWVPPGFAHGFCVLSETATFAYKCTDYYVRESELGVRWDDPAIGIEWPIDDPILSAKDAEAPRLADIPKEKLPKWRAT